jgi:hypothetical protein
LLFWLHLNQSSNSVTFVDIIVPLISKKSSQTACGAILSRRNICRNQYAVCNAITSCYVIGLCPNKHSAWRLYFHKLMVLVLILKISITIYRFVIGKVSLAITWNHIVFTVRLKDVMAFKSSSHCIIVTSLTTGKDKTVNGFHLNSNPWISYFVQLNTIFETVHPLVTLVIVKVFVVAFEYGAVLDTSAQVVPLVDNCHW